MGVLDVLALAVVAFFAYRLVVAARQSLRRDARRHTRAIVAGLRGRHFLPVPFVVALVFAAALLLVNVPGLDFGWWSAIGGAGNPVFGVTETTAGTPFELLVPVVFIALLLPALALFVEGEERAFRLGAEAWSWPKRVWKGLLFGLVHALIGIPIGFAIALSIGGWYFTATYLREWRRTHSPAAALLESTRAHLAYNLTIIAVVVAFLAAIVVIDLLLPQVRPHLEFGL